MADYPTVLLFDGPTRLGTLRVDNPTTVGHVLTVTGTSPLAVAWQAGGGGGGTDHAALSNLVWTSSAHTGTANRVAAFDGSGAASYLAVGTDLQAYDLLLTNIAALSMVADRYIYGTGTDTVALGTITAFARTILDDVDAAAVRTTIGAGTGSGDVVGPASANDNHLARYDGTTGKLLQDSAVHLTDTGALRPATTDVQQLGNKDYIWQETWALQYTMGVQAAVQTPSGGWTTSQAAFWTITGGAPKHTYNGTTRDLLHSGTAVTIAQGGTGQTTASAAFDALKQTGTTTSAGVFEAATPAEQSSTTVLTSDDHRLIYSYPPDKCGSRTSAGNAAGSGTGFLEGITYFATPARNYIAGFGHIDSNTSSTSADRGWYLTPATNSHLTFAKLVGSRVSAKFAVPSDNLRGFVAFTEAGAPTLVPANAGNVLEVIRLGVYNNVFTWSISDGTNETTGSLTAVGHTAGTVYEYEIIWTSSSSVTFNIYNADRSTLLETTTRTTGIPASGSTTTCYIGVFIRTASTTPTVYYGLGRLRIP
jgi:hypothetical protein